MRALRLVLTLATAALGLALVVLTAALRWWVTAHDIPTEESTLDEKQ